MVSARGDSVWVTVADRVPLFRGWLGDHTPAAVTAGSLEPGRPEQSRWAAGGGRQAGGRGVPGAGRNWGRDHGGSGGGVPVHPRVLGRAVPDGARVERTLRLGAGSRLCVDGALDADF